MQSADCFDFTEKLIRCAAQAGISVDCADSLPETPQVQICPGQTLLTAELYYMRQLQAAEISQE